MRGRVCALSLARMHFQRAPACGVRTRSRACASSYGSLSRLSRRHVGARTRTASSKWSSTPRGTMSLGIILQWPCWSVVAPWSLCVAREPHPNRWDSMDKSAPAATRAETVANWQNDAARCTGVQLHAAAGCTALACGTPACQQGLSGHSQGTLGVLSGYSQDTLGVLSGYSRGLREEADPLFACALTTEPCASRSFTSAGWPCDAAVCSAVRLHAVCATWHAHAVRQGCVRGLG